MGRAFNLNGLLAGITALGLAAALPARAAGVVSSYVLLGEGGARVARALTTADHCPSITVDGRRAPMRLRAPAQTEPLRPTRSDPKDSKPSAFPLLTCEAAVPARARAARVAGRDLPLPPARITRIVVIGDTGCRLKIADDAYQACNDPKAYPFAQVATAAAAWKPQLVIHVGDYLYRENGCQDGHPGCAGSVWGYGADAWRADFFTPADPLLRAAAWAVVRGNHENCNRAGQGWWRFLDPRPLVPGRDCNQAAYDTIGDYSDPYGVPLGDGYQLIVNDSSNTPGGPLAEGDIRAARYRDAYAKMAALAAQAPRNIVAQHHPVLGFAAHLNKAGEPKLDPGNGGLQSVWGPLSPTYFPAKVDFLLAGHIHLWEMVNFSSPHPAQFIAGFSGTLEDIVPLPATPTDAATPAPGAVVKAMSSWIDGFGFMTLERVGENRWLAQVHDIGGVVVNRCEIEASKAACDVAQVGRR